MQRAERGGPEVRKSRRNAACSHARSADQVLWKANVSFILDHGAEVAAGNHKGVSALLLAATGGHETVAKQLPE
jgi:ankyrin repeat protein